MARRAERLWPTWVWTVGAMREADVAVYAHCRRCDIWLDVDLETLCAMRGRGFTLIDRTARCKVRGCGGSCTFHYSPGENLPLRVLLS